jgi:putative component of membrane protein insertase Oxa1/YidC/SpoIIIJ protein YidD
MTTAAVTAIGLYQQYLSPYKGFRCAHRVKHGRNSCSQFAKRLIEKVGLMRFAPIFLRRLRRCGKAARDLKAAPMSAAAEEERNHRSHRRNSSCDGCDPVPDLGGCDAPGVPDGCDGASGCDGAGCDFSI